MNTNSQTRRGLLALALPALCAAASKKRKKKQKAARPVEAKIGGTVFASSGRLIPGAALTARPTAGKGRYRALADRRGEYLIRVPAGDAEYVVTAEAKGFLSLTKTVSVYGEDKANANFLLEPEP